MATADINGLIWAGGSLCVAPTDVTTGSFPWGGTALGLVKNVVAKVGRRVTPIREEAFGPMPLTGVDLGEAWVLTGTFRGFDVDVVQSIFASTAAGSITGLRGVQYPNGNAYRTGGLISNLGVRLLLTPDNYEGQRFFLAYNAVPLTDEDGALPFQRGEELVMPFRFLCLPDGSNRTVAWHLREDLQSILT